MIEILTLTNSDAVRAVLGVDEEELGDPVMVSAGLDDELYLDITSWLPEGYTIESIVEDGADADPGTQENTVYLRLSSYSKAFCARYLLASQANWRLVRLTDGNIDERRNPEADQEEFLAELLALMAKHKQGLLDLIETPEAIGGGFSVMGVSGSSYDPVTG